MCLDQTTHQVQIFDLTSHLSRSPAQVNKNLASSFCFFFFRFFAFLSFYFFDFQFFLFEPKPSADRQQFFSFRISCCFFLFVAIFALLCMFFVFLFELESNESRQQFFFLVMIYLLLYIIFNTSRMLAVLPPPPKRSEQFGQREHSSKQQPGF